MNIKLSTALGILFTILAFTYIGTQYVNKPRVLIINSSNEVLSDTKEIIDGAANKLHESNYINVYKHNLRLTNRHDHRRDCHELDLIKNWRPNVVIAIDPAAQDLITHCQLQNFPVQYLFSNYESSPNYEIINKLLNFNGVSTFNPYKELAMLIEGTFPNSKRVIIITDSKHRIPDQHAFLDAQWDKLQLADTIVAKTATEWKAAIQQAQQRADVILIGHYATTLKNEDLNGKAFVSELLSTSNLPMIGLNDEFAEDLGPLSFAISEKELGESLASIAKLLIDTRGSAKDIDVYRDSVFELHINYKVFKTRHPNNEIPGVYQAYALASDTFNYQ